MDSSGNQCLLKILSGPHQGAEVLLRPGTYTVGASEACDIIISDSLFEAEHFRLVFTPPALSLEPLSGPVFLNGKRVVEGPVAVPFLQFITVGTTQMVAGPDGGGWPPLTVADAPALQLEDSSVPSKDAAVLPMADNHTPVEPSVNTLADAMGLASGQPMTSSLLDPLPAASSSSGGISITLWLVLILGLSVCGGGIYWIYQQVSSPSMPEHQVITPQERRTRVLQAIELQGAGKELSVTLSQNIVLITGCTQKEATRLSLRRAVLQVDPQALYRVQSEEALVNAAQIVMGELSLPVRITAAAQAGSLRATGYVPTMELWMRAKAFLMHDVDGLKSLEDNVLTADGLDSLALPLLTAQGLAGAITFTPMPHFVLATGSLTRAQGKRWDGVLTELKQKLGGRLLIKDEASRADPLAIDNQYFDGEIESLSTGQFGFISLKNGQKYFVGAVLPSGYTVVSLDDQGVTLRKGEEAVVFKPQHP